jgi:hypothetical protein
LFETGRQAGFFSPGDPCRPPVTTFSLNKINAVAEA